MVLLLLQAQTMTTSRVLLKGDDSFSVVVKGTSFCQTNLRRIVGTLNGTSSVIEATLNSEPKNKHDPNAISVSISNLMVGYVPQEFAYFLKQHMSRHGITILKAKCRAIVTFANDELFDEMPNVGVRLDISTLTKRVRNFLRSSSNLFVPSMQSKVIGDSFVHDSEIFPIGVGHLVKFWPNIHKKDQVIIYIGNSLGGSGRLGYVPDSLSISFYRHLQSGLPIDGTVEEILDGHCIISFKVITAEENRLLNEQIRISFLESLNQPMRRAEKIEVQAYDTSGKWRKLFTGESLTLFKMPSAAECFARENLPNVFFQTQVGEMFLGCDSAAFERKLVRSRCSAADVECVVIGESTYKPDHYQVNVRIPKTAK